MSKNDFNECLFEAIDTGLFSLGESARQAIYFHLEENFNIRKEEIPFKIEGFSAAIEEIFNSGAKFLETIILRHLFEKVGKGFEENRSRRLAFIENVASAETSFLMKKKVDSTVQLGCIVTEVEKCETK